MFVRWFTDFYKLMFLKRLFIRLKSDQVLFGVQRRAFAAFAQNLSTELSTDVVGKIEWRSASNSMLRGLCSGAQKVPKRTS